MSLGVFVKIREIGRSSGFLMLVIAIYCLLAALYAVVVPPWESPDEPAHYRYVMQLAERWRPPTDPTIRQRASFCRDYAFTTSNYEWYHPALGYLPLAVVYKVSSFLLPGSLPVDFPPFNPLFCSDPFRNPNLFHQEVNRLLDIWRGQWGLAILRFLSSLWGVVIVYATYKVGQWMKMEGFEIVAASWVAFLPQFTFISATVRNDTVTNALSAIVFLLAVRMQNPAERYNWLAAATGLTLGAGILAKLTTVYLIPMALVAVALSATFAKKWPGLVIGFFLPLVILVGGYYLVYPEARSALSYMSAHLSVKPRAFSWVYWKPFFPMLIELFFARFGWANIRVPGLWIVCAAGIWALGFGASVFCGVDLLRKDKIDQKQFLARVLLLLFLGLLLAFLGVVWYNLAVFQPQGRFLFPAVVSWALLGTWGFSFVLPERTKAVVGFGMILFMLAFNIRSLIALVQTYY